MNSRIGARQAVAMAIGTAVMVGSLAYSFPRLADGGDGEWLAVAVLFAGSTLGALIVIAGLLDLPRRIRDRRRPGRRSAGWD